MTPIQQQAEKLGLSVHSNSLGYFVSDKKGVLFTMLSKDELELMVKTYEAARSSTIEEIAGEFTDKTFTIEYHHVDGNHIAKHIRSLK